MAATQCFKHVSVSKASLGLSMTAIRKLSLLECKSKQLLQKHNVNIQKFTVISAVNNVETVTDLIKAKEYVIKAQIQAGGRGKGHFDNGFKGGVHLTKYPLQISSIVSKMIGHRLITKQTPKDGILVNEVMVAESVDIAKETYFCILMDRSYNGPVIIASSYGGMEIESVAEKSADLIKTVPVDIYKGITDSMAEDVAHFLNFPTNTMAEAAAEEIKKLWSVFVANDATQVEINPLVQTTDNRIISLDAKIEIDDNAAFRQKELFDQHDDSQTADPKEVEANQYHLNYISMDGNIGCLVNGAGLAMATMDIIQLYGGKPANFLDVGGNVNEEQVYHAFRILTSDSKVKSILVNVFGGIVNCGTIAKGIINAATNLELAVPVIVRLEGTNVQEGKHLLHSSGMLIQFANDLDEAAKNAVEGALLNV